MKKVLLLSIVCSILIYLLHSCFPYDMYDSYDGLPDAPSEIIASGYWKLEGMRMSDSIGHAIEEETRMQLQGNPFYLVFKPFGCFGNRSYEFTDDFSIFQESKKWYVEADSTTLNLNSIQHKLVTVTDSILEYELDEYSNEWILEDKFPEVADQKIIITFSKVSDSEINQNVPALTNQPRTFYLNFFPNYESIDYHVSNAGLSDLNWCFNSFVTEYTLGNETIYMIGHVWKDDNAEIKLYFDFRQKFEYDEGEAGFLADSDDLPYRGTAGVVSTSSEFQFLNGMSGPYFSKESQYETDPYEDEFSYMVFDRRTDDESLYGSLGWDGSEYYFKLWFVDL